jgi:hypothetical protein
VNAGIIFALIVSDIIQGSTLPKTTDIHGMENCGNKWRIGFYSPAGFSALGMLMWFFILRQDALLYLIDQDRLDDAFRQFKKVYVFENEEQQQAAWTKMQEDRAEFKLTKTVEPNLKTIFCDRRYKPLTSFLIISAIIN